MKYLLVIPAVGPVYGGPSKIALALAGALARQGTTVDLITTVANGRANLDVPVNRWLPQDYGAWRLRYFSRHGYAELKPSLPMAYWLWRHVMDYDCVYHISIFNVSAAATAVACRARNVPYIVNPQGMLEPWALGYKSWKKRGYYELVERPVVLRGASIIHALNRREAANLAQLRLGPPLVVIPNGIDAADARPGGKSEIEKFLAQFPVARGRKLILFLHRIDPKKGLDLLADAYARVRREFPDTHVVVAGSDNIGYAETAKGFFDSAGVGDAVTFTGMLEGELKRGALAASSVFVAPSYSEGFSMSVLEAMAAGLPCVITQGCNFPEAGEAGAARVTAVDAGAFATALHELLRDGDAAADVGARGRDLVLRNYSWDSVAAQLHEVCCNILSGRGIPNAARIR